MTEFEKLIDYAYERNIDTYSEYYTSQAKGSCLTNEYGSIVVINKRVVNDKTDELCVLAEEIGHIETGAVLPVTDYINPDYKKWLKRKNEILACRWAIVRLIPPNRIQAALNNCCSNDYEIANYCGVTTEFLHSAVEYYKRKGIVFTSNSD
jgi:hypothetical protein